MKTQILTLAAACVLASPTFAAPPLYDQNVTPDAIFGSGNANGAFTLDRSNGVELGLRAKQRFPAANIFNSNGDGTYTFKNGFGGGSDPLNPKWHFEWSVNSDWDTSSPYLLKNITCEIGMDYDSGPDAFYETFDLIAPPSVAPFYWDHSIGTNATGNGLGDEAGSNAAYVALLAGNNVAQNSWRPTFYDNYYFTFDPDDIGRYEYYLSAFDGAGRVAHSAITIFALDKVSLTIDGEGCQGVDQDLVTPGHQIKVTLNIRNPDSVSITGYQAFLKFNSGTMTYVGATSSYSATPFPNHFQPIGGANVDTGEIRLDGSVAPLAPAITGGAHLATLYFTVASGGCGDHVVEFDTDEPFDSEVSNVGVPYATTLLDSPTFGTDSTPPTILVQPTLTVNAEPALCSADIFPQKFPFNLDPTLSATQVPGTFYTDRYAPYLFETEYFDGDFRLHHQVNAADSAANRPPAYSSAFYNTQGRKFDVNSGVGSSVSMDLYIGSDWATDDRRADLWLTTFDNNNLISGYPILGYAHIAGGPWAGGAFRIYTQDIDQNPGNGYTPDWISLGLPGGFAYDKWYTLRITLHGGAYLFEVLDNGTPVLSYVDGITEGSVLIGNSIIQAYNFGSTYDVYWDNFQIAGQYPTTSDGCGGLPTVTAVRSDSQPLTSPYPVGNTTITWTATDDCGNETTANQVVTVLSTVLVNVTAQLQGSGPATRCIRFVPNTCASDEFVLVDFFGGPGTGAASIELPCGTWSSLCAKDEQHTQWATTTLINMGTHYEASSLLVLKAGDTDNDGDVDINDVTLFLAQYGTSPASGGCPWDGTTRSADFNNDNIVGTDDYSAFTANWLTTSGCMCTMPSEAPARFVRVHDATSAKADLDGNGRVDVRDVELLERRHGLSGQLSRRMREQK
ncbi:MAG: hypothetical protein JNL80_06460 [Phycisphaerae bacterium]|jgi:hypothetical protein|nr:hypothetical protein [Phycisphaerae bacterium]